MKVSWLMVETMFVVEAKVVEELVMVVAMGREDMVVAVAVEYLKTVVAVPQTFIFSWKKSSTPTSSSPISNWLIISSQE